MKQFITITFLLIALVSQAQKEKGQAYVNAYKDIAVAEMIRSGVPASITLAQGILESQYGESDLCKQSNNHFGIKCKEDWTGDKVYHDDDARHECFRSYSNAAESYKDHSDFLKSRPHYAFLFQLEPTDYVGWAKGLKKAGYATEKDYTQRLLQLINDYDLNQYTVLALQQKQNAEQNMAANTGDEIVKDTMLGELVIPMSSKRLKTASTTDAEEKEEEETPAPKSEMAIIAKEKSLYPDSVFTINHTKVVFAKEGTSLLSIANKYDIILSRLLDFNEMDEMDILNADKLIFLEKKMKKGSTDFHVVKGHETLYDICQVEGVRLESIMEYNSLKKDAHPSVGSKIYLRAMAPKAGSPTGDTAAAGHIAQ